MNNQLSKLQQKPKTQSFRPVTIKLSQEQQFVKRINKRNDENDERNGEGDERNDAKQFTTIKPQIIDRSATNMNRNELLKKFTLSQKTLPLPSKKITNTLYQQPINITPNITTDEIQKKDEVLSDIIETLENSRVIRTTKEDLKKEGENIQREYDIELEQKLQQDLPGEQDNQDDVIWKRDNSKISFFPESVDVSELPTIYETNEETQNDESNIDKETQNDESNIDKDINIKNKKISKAKQRQKQTKMNKDVEDDDEFPSSDTTNGMEKYKRMIYPNGGRDELHKHHSYYLNNRKYFINFINNIFLKYRDQLNSERSMINCENEITHNYNKCLPRFKNKLEMLVF
jgi:hypothetical protein